LARATGTSFPLSKHTGGDDTAPAFSGRCVYLQVTWEVGLPPSPVEFSFHRHFYKLSCSWLLGVCCHSCLLQLACCEGFPLPTFSALRVPRPFATCLFCCYCLLFSCYWDNSIIMHTFPYLNSLFYLNLKQMSVWGSWIEMLCCLFPQ
jgi:hypothetical protein